MDDNNIRRFNRATRVKTFGESYAADFAPGSKATTLFLELNPIVIRLNEATVGQLRTPVGKPELIAALSLDFKDIARTARAIKIDQPGFDDSAYRHPATSVENPVTTHADSLLKLLEDNTAPVADGGDTPAQLAEKATLRTKFIAYELPVDFVEDLRADRDALDACNTGKHLRHRHPPQPGPSHRHPPRRRHPKQIQPRPRQARRLEKRLPHRALRKESRSPRHSAARGLNQEWGHSCPH